MDRYIRRGIIQSHLHRNNSWLHKDIPYNIWDKEDYNNKYCQNNRRNKHPFRCFFRLDREGILFTFSSKRIKNNIKTIYKRKHARDPRDNEENHSPSRTLKQLKVLNRSEEHTSE